MPPRAAGVLVGRVPVLARQRDDDPDPLPAAPRRDGTSAARESRPDDLTELSKLGNTKELTTFLSACVCAWAPANGMTNLDWAVLYSGMRACYIRVRSGWGSDGNVHNVLHGF